jgi:hypothetical protein
MEWFNPSRSAEIWDPLNNRHIRPRETTNIKPDNRLITGGKMIPVAPEDPRPAQPTVPAHQAPQPVQRVTAAIELVDRPVPSTSKPKPKLKLTELPVQPTPPAVA